ncbi:MAG: GNAT family N-acetyltransferase [Sphaerochaeta sp.]
MHIIATQELSASQQEEVEELEQWAKEEEGLQGRLFLSNRLNTDPDIPCFFLGYEHNRLVSFLCAFFPTDEEAEFSGYTHPRFRSRGHFSALVEQALTEYASLPFKQILFTAEATSASGQAYLASRYPHIERSEYLMLLRRDEYKPQKASGTLRVVDRMNREEAARMMSLIFEGSLEKSRDRMLVMLMQEGRRVFIHYHDDRPVGVFNAQFEEPSSYKIYGVGVLKEERSHGYGTAMMRQGIDVLFLDATELTLEVESTNEHAIALYTALGFRPVMQVDYHRLPFSL